MRKLSPEKATYPDAKQVFRNRSPDGRFCGDTLILQSERLSGETLLIPAIRNGEPAEPLPTLLEIQARARTQRAALPDSVRRLHDAGAYPVVVSDGIRRLMAEMHPED